METATYEIDVMTPARTASNGVAQQHAPSPAEIKPPVTPSPKTYAEIAAALSQVKADLLVAMEDGFPPITQSPDESPEERVHQELENFIRISGDAKAIHALLMRMCAQPHRA